MQSTYPYPRGHETSLSLPSISSHTDPDTLVSYLLFPRMSDKLCSYLNPENHIMGMTRNKKKRMASDAKNALLQQASQLPEAASATPV